MVKTIWRLREGHVACLWQTVFANRIKIEALNSIIPMILHSWITCYRIPFISPIYSHWLSFHLIDSWLQLAPEVYGWQKCARELHDGDDDDNYDDDIDDDDDNGDGGSDAKVMIMILMIIMVMTIMIRMAMIIVVINAITIKIR